MQSRQKVRILHVTPSQAGHSYKNPTMGLKNRVQMPHPGTTPNLYFPVNKLQIPYLWDISNNLFKTREAPYANCSATSYNYSKKDDIDLFNDRIITRILIPPFLFLKTLNIVNDKQTTDELNMTIFSSRWNLFVSVIGKVR